MTSSNPTELVEGYVAAAQRARTTQDEADFARLREFLAEDVVIRMASPWTDEPWRVVSSTAEELLVRLTAPINRASSLATENVNVVRAGEDVLVEQLSTVTRNGHNHVSMVCHIFSVDGDRITGIRAYRNDAGLPAG